MPRRQNNHTQSAAHLLQTLCHKRGSEPLSWCRYLATAQTTPRLHRCLLAVANRCVVWRFPAIHHPAPDSILPPLLFLPPPHPIHVLYSLPLLMVILPLLSPLLLLHYKNMNLSYRSVLKFDGYVQAIEFTANTGTCNSSSSATGSKNGRKVAWSNVLHIALSLATSTFFAKQASAKSKTKIRRMILMYHHSCSSSNRRCT